MSDELEAQCRIARALCQPLPCKPDHPRCWVAIGPKALRHHGECDACGAAARSPPPAHGIVLQRIARLSR